MAQSRLIRDVVDVAPAGRRAFTLIELLVVIGIIALLVGFTIPAVLKAQRQGAITAQKLEFQSIEAGLIAYKSDFQEYPLVLYQDSGAEVLGKALLGPGPAVQSNPGPPFQVNQFYGIAPGPFYACLQATSTTPTLGAPEWQQLTIPYDDLNDSFGSRVRAQGKVFGPYLDSSKFRVRGLQILDHWGNPILYFAGNLKKPSYTAMPAVYSTTNLATFPYLGQMSTAADNQNNNKYQGAHKFTFTSLFDAGDNISAFIRPGESAMPMPPVAAPSASNAHKRIAILLGDYAPHTPGQTTANTTDFNGIIDNGESAFTGDYVLWSAGPDGQYGITTLSPLPTAADLQKCDDVLNTP